MAAVDDAPGDPIRRHHSTLCELADPPCTAYDWAASIDITLSANGLLRHPYPANCVERQVAVDAGGTTTTSTAWPVDPDYAAAIPASHNGAGRHH